MGKMNRLYPLRFIKFKLYVQCFLNGLLFGYLFRKIDDCPNKCKICGKPLKNKRIEISITRPDFNYEFEFDEFLCIDHALQYLYNYRIYYKEV